MSLINIQRILDNQFELNDILTWGTGIPNKKVISDFKEFVAFEKKEEKNEKKKAYKEAVKEAKLRVEVFKEEESNRLDKISKEMLELAREMYT